MNSTLDPRIHAYRPDLADRRLEGMVEAPSFVDGATFTVSTTRVPLWQNSRLDSRWGSELLYGETVQVFDIRRGLAWCQSDTDGYVGYVAAEALQAATDPPTHRVRAIRAPIFPEADLKKPVVTWRSIASRVSLTGQEKKRFLELTDGTWIYSRHVEPIETVTEDYIATAKRFMELPYIWGGRSGAGLDCSALIQLCLNFAGMDDCPRDTDQQREGLGKMLPPDTPLKTGDFTFFPGHIGIMLDDTMMLHANATHMAVSIDAAAEVASWTLKSDGAGITGVNRL